MTMKDRANIAAAKRLFKRAEGRPALEHQWIDEKGRQCLCDGFIAFRINPGHFIPLPERPADAPKPVDLDKVFQTPEKLSAMKPFEQTLTVELLKNHIKSIEERAQNDSFGDVKKRKELRTSRMIIQLEGGAPMVNPEYLKDVLTVIGDYLADTKTECLYTGNLNPVYFRSEVGEALLMHIKPIRYALEDRINDILFRYNERCELVERSKRYHPDEDDYYIHSDDFSYLVELMNALDAAKAG